MIISKTPYRISFFGGGSDYPDWYNEYSGAVLSTTINKHLYITCRILPNFFDHKFRVVWSKIENVQNINDIKHAEEIIKSGKADLVSFGRKFINSPTWLIKELLYYKKKVNIRVVRFVCVVGKDAAAISSSVCVAVCWWWW